MGTKGDKNGQNVTAKQFKAIESLLESGDITQAAEAAGVTRKTVHAWLNQEDFSAMLGEARVAILQGLTCQTIRIGGKALKTVEAALDDEASLTTPTRLQAAKIAIGLLSRILDISNRKKRK